eukprot:10604351-Ditylum_brightwellii.AAC.1
MQAGGAMTLLLGKVDTDIIQLIRRWCNDKMLCYLHMTAHQIMQNHATTMVLHGKYTFYQPSSYTMWPAFTWQQGRWNGGFHPQPQRVR